MTQQQLLTKQLADETWPSSRQKLRQEGMSNPNEFAKQ